MSDISLQTVEDGLELFLKAVWHMQGHETNRRDTVKAALKKNADTFTNAQGNLSDLDSEGSKVKKGW